MPRAGTTIGHLGDAHHAATVAALDRNPARPRRDQAVLLEVYDREDAREKTYLETSRRELMSMLQSKRPALRSADRIAV
jgi:hypothetical protein